MKILKYTPLKLLFTLVGVGLVLLITTLIKNNFTEDKEPFLIFNNAFSQDLFIDINSSHEHYDAIGYGYSKGIIHGYDDGNYLPYKKINRVELLKIVIEATRSHEDIQNCNVHQFNFPDTPIDQWYSPYICVGKRDGIVSGFEDGYYRPVRNINFVEAAKIISLAYSRENVSDKIWYKPHVEYLETHQAIPESIKGFCYNVNRGEIIEMIYRIDSELDKKSSQTYQDLSLKNDCINEADFNSSTIPVMMYHYVRFVDKNSDPVGYNLSIEPPILEQQLKWLEENNIKTVHLSDINRLGKAPQKSVVLLFDDGYKDFYTEAFPLLKKYNLTATVAIITEKIGADGYLNEDDINDLLNHDFEIVSHTHTHRELTKINSADLDFELSQSQNILREKFGVNTSILVYPVGKYNQVVINAAKKYYDMAFTTEGGVADLTTEKLSLPRIRIDNRNGLNGFINSLSDALKI